MSKYIFENIVCQKIGACDKYIGDNLSWIKPLFSGLSTSPFTVYTNVALTEEQIALLTSLLNNYIDPAIYLTFNSTMTMPLYSTFTSNNSSILQTFIYDKTPQQDDTVLNSLKTIIEYHCPNVQNFINTTSGNITLQIYDLSRNITISSKNTELNNVAQEWNRLASEGVTTGNTIYRTEQFYGLMNSSPDYNVIWQLIGNTSNQDFSFCCNSLQFLYYNVE